MPAAEALARGRRARTSPQPKEGVGAPQRIAVRDRARHHARRPGRRARGDGDHRRRARESQLTGAGARASRRASAGSRGDPFALLVQRASVELLADADVWGTAPSRPYLRGSCPRCTGRRCGPLAALDGAPRRAAPRHDATPARTSPPTAATSAGLYPSGAFHAIDVVIGAREPRERRLPRRQPRSRSASTASSTRASRGLPDQLTMRPGRAGGRGRAAQDGRRARGRGTGRWPCRRRCTRSTPRAARRTSSRSRSSSPSGSGACSTRSRQALACELVALRQAAHLAEDRIDERLARRAGAAPRRRGRAGRARPLPRVTTSDACASARRERRDPELSPPAAPIG